MTVIEVRKYGSRSVACVGAGECRPKSLNKPQKTELEKLNLPYMKVRKEFVCSREPQVGEKVMPVSLFQLGEKFSFTGRTIGRGTAGAVKRWGFGGMPASHGTSKTERCLGSTGSRTQPGRVFKNKKMPGHYGNERVCIHGIRLLDLDQEKEILVVAGSLPGKQGWLEARRR